MKIIILGLLLFTCSIFANKQEEERSAHHCWIQITKAVLSSDREVFLSHLTGETRDFFLNIAEEDMKIVKKYFEGMPSKFIAEYPDPKNPLKMLLILKRGKFVVTEVFIKEFNNWKWSKTIKGQVPK
ncbi:MAG: hypothetical protein NE330_10765 [Lentisphaeraceae bacterium]|nr:hypothetical protein [Lentisphaeraceae bacterium]